jgi:hypothetical protein
MRTLIISTVCLLSALLSTAQTDSTSNKGCASHLLSPSISAGTLVGGQFNSGGFYYKSGFAAYLSLDACRRERLQVGFGAGIERMPQEWFFPMYLQLRSSMSDQTTGGFFILQVGYTFSIMEAYNYYRGSEDHGGLMISPGWGYKIQLEKSAQLYFTTQFKQQNLSIDYTTEAGSRFSDQFTYNFLTLNAGIRF